MVATIDIDSFASFKQQQYLLLTTFRKNGTPVPTPVWFAPSEGRFYVQTTASAGKVKRLRHTSTVQLAPCTARGQVLGDAVDARARVLAEGDPVRGVAESALRRKYGLKRVAFRLVMRARLPGRRPTPSVYLEIEPA